MISVKNAIFLKDFLAIMLIILPEIILSQENDLTDRIIIRSMVLDDVFA